jgi:hypothetical protein
MIEDAIVDSGLDGVVLTDFVMLDCLLAGDLESFRARQK